MDPNNDKSNKIRVYLMVALIVIAIIAVVVIFFVLRGRTQKIVSTETPIEFPTSGNATGTIPSGTTTGGATPGDLGGLIPQKKVLAKIYDGPVGGYTVLNQEDANSSSTRVRLFDRAQGLFVDVDVNTGEVTTLADKALLNMHDAYFLADGKVIVRALDDKGVIRSLLYTLTPSSIVGTKPFTLDEPKALAPNIKEIGVSPSGRYAVFVIDRGTDAAIDLYDSRTGDITEIATPALSEWIPSVNDSGKVYLAAKTAAKYMSGVYLVQDGKLRPAIEAREAQTVLMGKSGTALVTYRDNSTFVAALNPTGYSGADNNSVPFATIAEKCALDESVASSTKVYCGIPVMIPPGGFPDNWYQGKYASHDALYSYDMATDARTLVASPWDELNTNLDMVDLKMMGSLVFFSDKTSGSLYRALTQNLGSSSSEGE